jgi:hypothetical protein
MTMLSRFVRRGVQPKVRIAASEVLRLVTLVASGLSVSLVAAYVPVSCLERQPSAFVAWNPQREVPGLEGLIDTVRDVRKIS